MKQDKLVRVCCAEHLWLQGKHFFNPTTAVNDWHQGYINLYSCSILISAASESSVNLTTYSLCTARYILYAGWSPASRGFRWLHTESGCGLRTGLWPTAVFIHVARTPSLTTTAIRLKAILSKPWAVRTEKIQPDTANGAYVKTPVGHKPVRKP